MEETLRKKGILVHLVVPDVPFFGRLAEIPESIADDSFAGVILDTVEVLLQIRKVDRQEEEDIEEDHGGAKSQHPASFLGREISFFRELLQRQVLRWLVRNMRLLRALFFRRRCSISFFRICFFTPCLFDKEAFYPNFLDH